MIFFKHTECWYLLDSNKPRGWFLSSCGACTIMVRKKNMTLHKALVFAGFFFFGIKEAAIAVAMWWKKLGSGVVCAAVLCRCAFGWLTPSCWVPHAMSWACPAVSGCTWDWQQPHCLPGEAVAIDRQLLVSWSTRTTSKRVGISVASCKGKSSLF